MRNVKAFINKHIYVIYLFLIITMVYLCFLVPYIVNKMPVSLDYDVIRQQYPFMTEFYNLIDEFFNTGSLPFYSWNTFLGSNFYASKSYYVVGDIYAWLGYLFKGIGIQNTLTLITYFKFLVSGLSMFALVQYTYKKDSVSLACGIMYAFSSFAVYYIIQSMFLSFYSLVPLYFLYLDKVLSKDKNGYIFFPLTVAALLSINYYFFYSLSIFTIIFALYRYINIHKTFEKIIRVAIKTIVLYFLGVALVAVIALPTFFYIINATRLASGSNIPLLFGFEEYRLMLIGYFTPSNVIENSILTYNFFETDYYVTNEVLLWSSGLSVVLMPQLLSIKKSLFKVTTIFLIILLGIMFCLPKFDSLMNGLAEPQFRWGAYIIFTNIYIAGYLLANHSEINKKNLILSSLVSAFIIVSVLPISLFVNGKGKELLSTFLEQYILFLICAMFIGIYFIVLYSNKKNLILLNIVLIIEVCFFGSYRYYSRMKYYDKYTYDFYSNMQSLYEQDGESLQSFLNRMNVDNENEYYRVFLEEGSAFDWYDYNASQYAKIHGLSRYDSTYNSSYSQMMRIDPSKAGDEWVSYIEDKNILSIASTKYAIVQYDIGVPKGIDWEFKGVFNGLQVYENKDYRSVGNTYTDIIQIENATLSDLNNKIIAEEKDIEEIRQLIKDSDVSLENIWIDGNSIHGEVVSNDGGFMVMSIPYDEGWQYYVNGNEVKTYMVNGGFTGFAINVGDNMIDAYFMPKGFKIGFLISSVSIVIFIISIFVIKKDDKKTERID